MSLVMASPILMGLVTRTISGFLADALVEQRRDRKADQKRQHDADHADDRSVLEESS
jgi:hypothetical protein